MNGYTSLFIRVTTYYCMAFQVRKEEYGPVWLSFRKSSMLWVGSSSIIFFIKTYTCLTVLGQSRWTAHKYEYWDMCEDDSKVSTGSPPTLFIIKRGLITMTRTIYLMMEPIHWHMVTIKSKTFNCRFSFLYLDG